MNLSPSPYRYVYRLASVLCLSLVFYALLIILENPAQAAKTWPVAYTSELLGPSPAPMISETFRLNYLTDPVNAVDLAFINAVPGSDGTEIFVSVSGVNSGSAPIVLNINPGSGPAGHRGGYAMTLSGTTYLATAIGFAPGQDVGSDGDDTMSISTTVGSNVVSTGALNFQRAFVEPTQPKTINVDGGDFKLSLLNANTVLSDTYLLVMGTNASPDSAPFGYSLVGQSYNLRPSGSLTQSQKPMLLNLGYQVPLPHSADPHNLSILRWNAFRRRWEDVGGGLLDKDQQVTLAVRQFGIYALATSPAWFDSFKSDTLSGLPVRQNVEWVSGEEVILLTTNALTGSAISPVITPTVSARWGTLIFSATTGLSTSLSIDLLDGDDNLILSNLSSGSDLNAAGIDPQTYPSLKIRAVFSSTTPGLTPKLHWWRLTWEPEMPMIYLPIVMRGG